MYFSIYDYSTQLLLQQHLRIWQLTISGLTVTNKNKATFVLKVVYDTPCHKK